MGHQSVSAQVVESGRVTLHAIAKFFLLIAPRLMIGCISCEETQATNSNCQAGGGINQILELN